MSNSISIIVSVAVIFAAMILQLAAKPAFTAKFTGILILLVATSGFFFYGYGYGQIEDNFLIAILRGVLGVCGMFVGKTDFNVISATPLKNSTAAALIFWLVHLGALYATASATIASIGAQAMKKLRLWLARQGKLFILYGVSSDTLAFAEDLAARMPHSSIVFVDPNPDGACASMVQNSYVLRTDADAVCAGVKFAKSIGLREKRGKITLYALSKDPGANARYASLLLKTLEARKIPSGQTELVMLGTPDSDAASLQALNNQYGYGYVTVFREAELAARLLIRTEPPCNRISFDSLGRAEENFQALIIGFGQTGQAVLRSLVMNGQAVGSTFRCDVFAPNCKDVSGFLSSACGELLNHYDIRFHSEDARSNRMYEFLRENCRTLKYVAVCTNNSHLNREITEDLLQYFRQMECRIPVYQCSHSGVICCKNDTPVSRESNIYTSGLLCCDTLDRMAMEVNQFYMAGNGKTAQENWMECDYFSRMSSRAAADFFPAVLRSAGTDPEQVLRQGFRPEGELLETLGQMEHLRWCAFHYAMGYSPMTQAEYTRRAGEYQSQKDRGEIPTIRIGKNTRERTHACLIPWEELDALSRRENAVTGGNVDYKFLDKQNVLSIEPILRSCGKPEDRK